MFKAFRDENADKMRGLAMTISKPVEKFQTAPSAAPLNKSAHPIASQFFSQPEVSVQSLSTEQLLESLAGGPVTERFVDGWKQVLQSWYPGLPSMWNLPKPGAGNLVDRPLNVAADGGRTSVGGAMWAENASGAKAATGAVSKSNEIDKESAERLATLGESIARLKAVQSLKAAVDAGAIDKKVLAAALAAA